MADAVCGCKGIRTCLLCEGKKKGAEVVRRGEEGAQHTLYQCHRCGKILPLEEGRIEDSSDGPLYLCSRPCSSSAVLQASYREQGCSDRTLNFEGVVVVKDFVSAEEEAQTVTAIDSRVWVDSQSGRRKQVNNDMTAETCTQAMPHWEIRGRGLGMWTLKLLLLLCGCGWLIISLLFCLIN